MIRVKIDVTKIDKERLFRGQKGIYCDITLIETPNDQYGNDYVAVQDLGKEAREAGEKGAILGNAKVFGQAPKPAAAQPKPAANAYIPVIDDDEEAIPF